jgi:hypothetical protein
LEVTISRECSTGRKPRASALAAIPRVFPAPAFLLRGFYCKLGIPNRFAPALRTAMAARKPVTPIPNEMLATSEIGRKDRKSVVV